jgi:gluconate:H+ symporter, GntP family
MFLTQGTLTSFLNRNCVFCRESAVSNQIQLNNMYLFASLAEAAGPGLWPFAVLLIAVLFIILTIAVLRVHAFLALILAAILVGAFSTTLPDEVGGIRVPEGHLVRAVEITMIEFGRAAGRIAVVIALASIIGLCLMESGAADKIVRRVMGTLGEKRAGIALLVSGFLLSIPVFFDMVFFLLIPIARVLSLRAGRNYMLYVMAICGGGAITHSIVAPTPGPLVVVESLQLDLGKSIIAGMLAGILPAIGVWYVAKLINRKVQVPMRETSGASLAEISASMQKKDEELPSFSLSILPVLLPVFLIAVASVLAMLARGADPEVGQGILYRVFGFLGNRNVALFIGALVAMWVLASQKNLGIRNLSQSLASPLESAGIIILITSAGGAFGAMIQHSGVGEAIRAAAEGRELNYVFLAWAITAVIRIAQGSATVAMITGASLMFAVIGDGSQLPYSPIYIFLAIGFGSMILSWMNDSGFWVVGRLSGFTEQETFKSWTVMVTAISLMGLAQCLIFSKILPLPQF